MEINSLGQTLKFFMTIMAELVALFVGISFLVALLREYVPESTIRRLLTGRRRGYGNILGAALGAVTPFCSCSTIPIMVGLMKAGAPFGSTISFLLASPLLNPVIILLFLAIFGWQVTVIYTVVCFLLVVLLGIAWEKLDLANHVKNVRISGESHVEKGDNDFRSRAYRALAEAWGLFRDTFPYLLIGVSIGSIIYGFLPITWVSKVAGPQNLLAIPVAAIIGVPLYIRVETMIPIGMVLLGKGMDIGAIMALIIGGAGASIPEVSLLCSIFKPRLVFAFVLTILTVAIVSGYIFHLML